MLGEIIRLVLGTKSWGATVRTRDFRLHNLRFFFDNGVVSVWRSMTRRQASPLRMGGEAGGRNNCAFAWCAVGV